MDAQNGRQTFKPPLHAVGLVMLQMLGGIYQQVLGSKNKFQKLRHIKVGKDGTT